MPQVSEHFSLAELTVTKTGLSNTPGPAELANLKRLAGVLEQVRALLGNRPITINSGYRSPEVNRKVGGSTTSDHRHGLAADIICPAYGSPHEIAKAIAASGIGFDQVIQEGTWVHIGVGPRMRRQALTYKGGKYLPGISR